ncbi:MAG TPA: YceI family protein [Burkholderiales bacterium]|nr:YceI family protein [Burkholderiales bacterium]
MLFKLCGALCLMATFAVHAVEYGTVLVDRSQVTFTSKQMGVPVEGRFPKFAAAIYFDPAKPETGHGKFELDMAAADGGSSEANDELKTKSWFNVREFPAATFVAEPNSVRTLGNNRFEAKGRMTIKGKARDVVVPFTYKPDGASAVLEGIIPVLRTQYGVGDGIWADTSVVADEVPVKFRFVVAPVAAKTTK